MITFKQKGDFSKLVKFIEKGKNSIDKDLLDKYGRMGVEALSNATPIDTGLTSKSWRYEINKSKSGFSIDFYNENIQNGVPIAIVIQFGHATGNGGWVEGIDYINPALKPVFEELAKVAWEEVIKL